MRLGAGAGTWPAAAGLQPVLAALAGLGELRGPLARAAAGTLGVRVANVLLVYGGTILLARILGAEDFGRYAYALAWANLLAVPAALGHEGLLTREVAVCQAQARWSEARGLLRWSNLVVTLGSAALVVVASLAAALLSPAAVQGHLPVLWLALSTLPLLALARIRQAALQGLRHVVAGQVPEMVVRPAIHMALIAAAWLLLGRAPGLTEAMAFQVAAGGAAFALGAWLLRRHLPPPLAQAKPVYRPRRWLRTAWPMLCVGGLYIVNGQADIIMLGALGDADSVGVYAVASRAAALVGFILLAFDTALAPSLASLHAQGDRARLQAIVTRSCRLTTVLSVLAAGGLVALGPAFLLLFGRDFLAAHATLAILCLGYLVNAVTGPVAQLLLMTGHERRTAWIVGGSALLNVVLNAALIPRFGPEGAAAATAVSMIAWNVALAFAARRRLGILALPFTPGRLLAVGTILDDRSHGSQAR